MCLTPCLAGCGSAPTTDSDTKTARIEKTADENPDATQDNECPDGECPDGKCPDGKCRNGRRKRTTPNMHGDTFKFPAADGLHIFEITFNDYRFPFHRHHKPAPEPEVPAPEEPELPSTEQDENN